MAGLRNKLASLVVQDAMSVDELTKSSSTRLWIEAGASLFLVALAVSAVVVPELRLLHFLQAMIYVAVIILAHRNSAWGFGAGFAIGIVWNCLGLFITQLIQAGVVAFWTSLHTGHIEQLVPMMVTLGGIGHFVLIIASLTALLHLRTEARKWWKFVGGGALAVAYFVLIIALARPH